MQVISWLPELRLPIEKVLTKIEPEWFAMTSLFFEGDISTTIVVNEHTTKRKFNYNIYSIKEVERIAAEYGYLVSRCQKFQMPTDLPKPSNNDLMTTYTRRVCDGENVELLQISGPLLMPWYMLMLEKNGEWFNGSF